MARFTESDVRTEQEAAYRIRDLKPGSKVVKMRRTPFPLGRDFYIPLAMAPIIPELVRINR